MKTLVYCGIHNCNTIMQLVDKFDVIFGFDANPKKIKAAAKILPPKVKKVFGALCEQDTGHIEFNIMKKWDASSSIGTFNPDFHHMRDPKSVLYGTEVKKIRVPCINLSNYLSRRNITKIDLLVTDLQGMDLTVLKTMEQWIREKRIVKIQCEAEKDDTPNIYEGVGNNKLSGFMELLSENYDLIEYKTVNGWWEGDGVWRLKGVDEPVEIEEPEFIPNPE